MTLRNTSDLIVSLLVPVWILSSFVLSPSSESAKFHLAILIIFVLVWFYTSVIYKPGILSRNKLLQAIFGAPLFITMFQYVFNEVLNIQMLYYSIYFVILAFIHLWLAEVQRSQDAVKGFAIDASATILGVSVGFIYNNLGWATKEEDFWNYTFIIVILLMIWFRVLLWMRTHKLVKQKYIDYLFLTPIVGTILVGFFRFVHFLAWT